MSIQKYNFIKEDLDLLFSNVQTSELNELRNSSVCITGGCGFIGTWISEIIYFLNQNYDFNTKVLIIDKDIDKIKVNAPHLLTAPHFQIQRADVKYLVELPKDVNYIIHAAASPSSQDHVANPVEVMSSIALGTENLLRAAERLSALKMILNLSSSLIYGSFYGRNGPIKETDFCNIDESSVSAPYAEAKRYSEFFSSAYRAQCRMPVAILRPFSVFGPYQPLLGPWALNNFISDAIDGRSIKILGDGDTLRSFLYASDVAFWILKSLINIESGSKFNLGSPHEVSLKDLAFLVQKNFTMKTDIVFCSGSGVVHRQNAMVPDTSLIQQKFNLKVTVPIEQAINRTIQWYKLVNNN